MSATFQCAGPSGVAPATSCKSAFGLRRFAARDVERVCIPLQVFK
jgi:hypothetical protein